MVLINYGSFFHRKVKSVMLTDRSVGENNQPQWYLLETNEKLSDTLRGHLSTFGNCPGFRSGFYHVKCYKSDVLIFPFRRQRLLNYACVVFKCQLISFSESTFASGNIKTWNVVSNVIPHSTLNFGKSDMIVGFWKLNFLRFYVWLQGENLHTLAKLIISPEIVEVALCNQDYSLF